MCSAPSVGGLSGRRPPQRAGRLSPCRWPPHGEAAALTRQAGCNGRCPLPRGLAVTLEAESWPRRTQPAHEPEMAEGTVCRGAPPRIEPGVRGHQAEGPGAQGPFAAPRKGPAPCRPPPWLRGQPWSVEQIPVSAVPVGVWEKSRERGRWPWMGSLGRRRHRAAGSVTWAFPLPLGLVASPEATCRPLQGDATLEGEGQCGLAPSPPRFPAQQGG